MCRQNLRPNGRARCVWLAPMIGRRWCPRASAMHAAHVMSSRASLLVVDNNELSRDALTRRLRQCGYTVQAAASATEALGLIDQIVFHLVLLDVEMPDMSGLELLRQLRATKSRTELPVIMVTARSGGDDVVEALSLGANDYVTKPVDFQVAVARIETHLEHKAAVADLRASEERYAL